MEKVNSQKLALCRSCTTGQVSKSKGQGSISQLVHLHIHSHCALSLVLGYLTLLCSTSAWVFTEANSAVAY